MINTPWIQRSYGKRRKNLPRNETSIEPFFSTKEMDKGTGLGLAMVYGAVKQNNGFINVYSEPGHGTTFKIYLPQHSAKADPRPEQKQTPAAVTDGETIRLARKHLGRLDLLITDVVMPEMNGRDLAGNLKSIYPDIRCLYMSGYTANVNARHGVLDPGVHFLQKPFSMQDMAAKIREALDREEATREKDWLRTNNLISTAIWGDFLVKQE